MQRALVCDELVELDLQSSELIELVDQRLDLANHKLEVFARRLVFLAESHSVSEPTGAFLKFS